MTLDELEELAQLGTASAIILTLVIIIGMLIRSGFDDD